VVTTENPAEAGPDTLVVSLDERAATRSVGDHLVALGHRRVAVLTDMAALGGKGEATRTTTVELAGPEQIPFWLSRERTIGVRDALVATGGSWSDVVLINAAANTRVAGEAAAGLALDRADRPTALVALSDVLALGALEALAVRGLRPGRDVSVTGFDDVAEASEAGLTTVRQPTLERGRIAGELLLDVPEDPALRRVVLPTQLIVRSTTGPAPH
jgi:DNA-binding LacI/PurR family transcriptional regulator